MLALPSRILYVDLETTGLDENKHAVIQIAAIYEVDGVERERFTALVSPGPMDEVSDEALEKNGRSKAEIYTYEQPVVAAAKLVEFLSKYIQPYVPEDKVYFCAYNADFDFRFLHAFMRKYSRVSLGNFCYGYKLDPMQMAVFLRSVGKLNTPNLKLGTLTGHFNVKHDNQHDAISDIEAARDLFKKFHEIFSRGVESL